MIDIEELKSQNEDLVYLGNTPEQYQDAIVGLTCDGNHVVYDYDKFAESLVSEGMTQEEAYEWIEYNTIRSLPYAGEYAPVVICTRLKGDCGSDARRRNCDRFATLPDALAAWRDVNPREAGPFDLWLFDTAKEGGSK